MKKRFNVCFMFLAISVFSIALIRSLKMDITIDESITYLYYITGKWSIHSITANNHLLNTILAFILNFITQSHYNVFILRVPNLIIYLGYIFYTYKISNLYKNKSVIATILLLNYSVNEFASLSRGYGMASAFILGGIYYYKLFLQEKSDKKLKVSIIYFLLASTANTINLIPTACFLLDAIVRLKIQKKLKITLLNNKKYFIIIFLLSSFVLSYHFILSFNDRYLKYTICTKKMFYCLIDTPIKYYGICNINCLLFLFILIVFYFFNLKSRKIEKDNLFYIIIFIFLIFIICKSIFSLMPSGRTLIPILSIYIISIIDFIKLLNLKISLKCLNIIIILFFIITFYKNINFNYTREWHPKYDIKELVEKTYKYNGTISFDTIYKKYDLILCEYYYEKYKFVYNYDLMNEEEHNKLKRKIY